MLAASPPLRYARQMTTPTLDRPVAVPQPGHGDTDDDDGFAHRFKHGDIERSLAGGVVITALCGYRRRVTRPNQGDRIECPTCRSLHELAESSDGLS